MEEGKFLGKGTSGGRKDNRREPNTNNLNNSCPVNNSNNILLRYLNEPYQTQNTGMTPIQLPGVPTQRPDPSPLIDFQGILNPFSSRPDGKQAPSITVSEKDPVMSQTGYSYETNVIRAPVSNEDLEGLSDEQGKAIQAILAGKNILLTGPAGTGKSHTLHRIRQIYERRGLKIGMTSTTGASAILIEGKTIHSWSGIGIASSKETALKRVMTYKGPQERILSTSLLIIDEVSMLPSQILDILDYVFRMIRNCQRPFGGIQILLCGDFYQLKPVKSDSYAFDSENWDNYIQEVHELNFIFRQDNAAFCKALNEIRIGEVSQTTVELLCSCLEKKFEGDIKPTELYPVNETVSIINDDELWKLASEHNNVREIGALDEVLENPKPRKPHDQKFYMDCKKRLNDNCLAPEILQLAIGAQVMLIKNLKVDAGLANGSRGVIVGFSDMGQPTVKFRNNMVVDIQTTTWTMRINETTKIRRTQFPLKLAWAISIHKSQGCTLDMVKMDLGSRTFAEGQFYTAISRARNVEGLSITTIDWDKIFVNKRVKEFYAKYGNR